MGEQKTVPIELDTKFSVGNPEVIQVKVTRLNGGSAILLVKGKSQGFSDLILFGNGPLHQSRSFRVVAKKQGAMADDGRHIFPPNSGVQMQPQGDGWLLKGQAKNLESWNNAKSWEHQSKGKVQSILKIHPMERLKAEQKITKLLQQAGFRKLEVKGVGNAILLQGDITSTQDKEFAESLAHEVFFNVRSQIRVPFERASNLRVHAKILELIHTNNRSLGIEWGQEVPGALHIGNLIGKANFQLDATLKIMEKTGQARLLAQPQLVLNEKGIAELKVGGEIPIHVKSRAFSGVQWKEYGLRLRIEVPGATRSLARSKITVDISGLDPNTGSDGVPGIRSSRMETEADLFLGKPVMLSGLMENRRREVTNAVPGLGSIPILGLLFQSKEFQENKSELVIILEARKRDTENDDSL